MRVDFHMPKLGVAVTEGTLTEWLVEDGEHVTEGAPLYLVSTDKVDNEIPAPATGHLICEVDSGEVYAVGTLLGAIETVGG